MQLGHINCVQVLLEDSDINLGAVNVRCVVYISNYYNLINIIL